MLSIPLIITASLLLASSCATESTVDDPCYLPEYCTPAQAIACARKADFGRDYYKSAIDDIITLLEPYVFLDILKNPPQPEGFSGYFKAVDLISSLKKVDTNPESFYDFYRSVKSILISAQDGHLGYSFYGNNEYANKLADFFAILPTVLYTKDVDGIPKMFALPRNEDLYTHFTDGDELIDIITNNTNVGLYSINGISPFQFVFNFGSKYYNFLKNANAKYTYASKFFTSVLPLYEFPLDVADFTDLTFVYENGDTFSTDFVFYNANPQPVNSTSNNREDKMSFTDFVRSSANKDANNNLPELLEKWKKGSSVNDIKRQPTDEEVLIRLKNMDIEKVMSQYAKRSKKSEWDYETEDGILKCLEDAANEANVYYINSFSPKDSKEFIGVLLNCAKMFNENSYPVIVINDGNGGGIVNLAAIFQEVLQPDMAVRFYASYKNNTDLRKLIEKSKFYRDLENAETCEGISSTDEMYENIETDNFGNGVFHSRTKPLLLSQLGTSKIMMKIRRHLTHTRKPTDIVVFTDSYSFSSGSFFTKGLKEAGAAILVGFNGFPGSTKSTFDIGQSPTNCITYDSGRIDRINEDAYNRLYEKGIIYDSISAGESFRVRDIQTRRGSTKTLVPREFLFDAADERAPIYNLYSYNDFISVGKSIIEKYKTQCNNENARLHMRDPACDDIINKTHMHGGYTCGTDGKWSTKCEGYYCDEGYLYDAGTDSCIQDVCPDMVIIEKNVTNMIVIICLFIAFALVVIIGIIVVSVFFSCYLNRSKRSPTAMRYQEL